jgi:Ca-activated chloride channel family protein
MKPFSYLFPILIAMLAWQSTARADAVLSKGDRLYFPSDIRVDVAIRSQVEVSTYLLQFSGVDESGDYVLTVPSPKGAYVIGVDMDRGAGFQPTAMVGEAPPPSIGGSSVAQDPEVAEWLGTRPLRADFAELATGTFTVRVRFQRLLRRYQGAVEFETGVARSPLRESSDLGATFSGGLTLSTSRQIVSLEVDGEGASVQQENSGASVQWGGSPGSALVGIRYQEALVDVGMHFLTHRTPGADPLGGSDGYFMLIVDADAASTSSAQGRTLSLVIDKSGSMSGGKIDQAREAARAMLDHLGPQDFFNIITFQDGLERFRAEAVAANSTAIADARDFIKDIESGGGTNLNLGVLAGLARSASSEADRFDAMILLSDGRATSGETDSARIHDNALLNNDAKARIYSFSVGSEADATLLEALARSNRGRHFDLNDAQATQEMLQQVNQLFEDIRVVRLTDLNLQMQGIASNQVLPEQMQDLFSGGQAVLVGRYSSTTNGSVSLTGKDQGASFLQSSSVATPALQEGNAFIKHLWASEKVASLLAEMSTGGDTNALREQIIDIGLAYRIQTPYTSFSTGGGGGGGGGGSGSGSGGGGGWSGGGSTAAGGLPYPLPIAFVLLLMSGLLLRRRREPC